MPVLIPSEYDQSYFDGKSVALMHNAGYSKYQRWKRFDLGSTEMPKTSLGEYWLDYANNLFTLQNLGNKEVLEIGCAKGFVVQDLRGMGVDCWGIDVSAYAIGEADPSVAPYLTVADALTHLSTYSNSQWDAVFSLRFMECVSEADLPNLIDEINRISKYQFHEIDIQPNALYYTVHDLAWWAALDWDRKTLLVARETGEEIKV